MPDFPRFRLPKLTIPAPSKLVPSASGPPKSASDLAPAGLAPSAVAGAITIPAGTKRTDIYTYFTVPDGVTKLLYSAEAWSRIRLTLETAGPVAVSTREDIAPVLTGKGILLDVGIEKEFDLPRGNRLYILSETINRVKFIVQPIAWQEELFTIIKTVGEAVVGALGKIRFPKLGGPPPAPKPPATEKIYCPPGAPPFPTRRKPGGDR